MAEITAAAVKDLRDRTGAGMMDCKKALIESDGDQERAIDLLRKTGVAKAAKRSGRVASEGMIHIATRDRSMAMVEVLSETDFVARTEDFQKFVKDVAMHIAAFRPLAVERDDLDSVVIERERAIYLEQAKNEGKPDHIAEKIVTGRLEKYYQEVCLLEQPFVKNPDQTVKDLVVELTAKVGERITIRRFACFRLGEED